MKKGYIHLGVIALLFGYVATVSAVTFSRSLKIGNSGDDVMVLQQVLNKDSRTAVAANGVGSPGQESRFFGPLTKQAVIRFQELYKDEVLLPIGLSRGTGFVGLMTIAKLNNFSSAALPSSNSAPAIFVNYLSASMARPGEPLAIYGLGFSGSAVSVVIGGQTVPASIVDSNTVSFTVPSNSLNGLHSVVLVIDGAVSAPLRLRINSSTYSAGFSGPSINQLSPSRGGYGTTINILGSGFSTSQTNTLYVGYDKLEGIASLDGKTLTFTIPVSIPHLSFPPSVFDDLAAEDIAPTLPFWVYVENDAGESNSALFTFTFNK